MLQSIKLNTNSDYSLHDSRINHLVIEENTLSFKFSSGFYKIEEPTLQINAMYCSVIFEDIDWDNSSVYVFRYSNDLPESNSDFTGRKYSISDYIKIMERENHELDIVNESYGYNQSYYSGYIMRGETILEFKLEIHHLGHRSYLVNI